MSNNNFSKIAKGNENSMEARPGCELAFMELALAKMNSPTIEWNALKDECGTVYHLDLTFTTSKQRAVLQLTRQGKNGRWKNSFAARAYYKRND